MERRVDLLAAEGVTFVTDTEVGKNYPGRDLRKQFDAVILCGRATRPHDFFRETPGRQLKGIHFAMEFLHANTKSLLDSSHADGQYISAKGKDVVVIGGGDTGTDCVGTSLRHGCRSLLQLEIVPQPPDQRAANNPWPQWPKVYKLDYGQEEAAALWATDPRKYLIQTTKFVGDEHGHVKELHTLWWTGRSRTAACRTRRLPVRNRSSARSWCCSRWASAGPRISYWISWASRRINARMPRRSTASSTPTCQASSRPGTCGADRAWWCGPSTRGAARRGSAIGS